MTFKWIKDFNLFWEFYLKRINIIWLRYQKYVSKICLFLFVIFIQTTSDNLTYVGFVTFIDFLKEGFTVIIIGFLIIFRNSTTQNIPQRIRVNGKEQNLSLTNFKEISGGPFAYFSKYVEEQFGNNTNPGWVLIDRAVIPESRGKDYHNQKKMVAARGSHA